ncbi:MAG: dihydrolipoamide acetyltransferase family protein [Vampirovibrionales bacterium]
MMMSLSSSQTHEPPTQDTPALYEFLLPDLGEGVAEGEVLQWLVEEGEHVEEDQSLCEVMTDKVTAEIPAPMAGILRQKGAAAGEKLAVGSMLALLELTTEAGMLKEAPVPKDSLTVPQETTPTPSTSVASPMTSLDSPIPSLEASHVKTSPAIRQLAKELAIDLRLIQGTGPQGRITREDFEQYRLHSLKAECPSSLSTPSVSNHYNVYGTATQTSDGAYHDLPYTGMRRTIGEHLSQAASTIPHFACVEAIRFDALMHLRESMKPLAEAEGIKLSYLPFVLKAVAEALRQVPSLNAHFNGQAIRRWHASHIGVAVATPEGGLVVPVIHEVQAKSLKLIAQELHTLAHAARHQQLQRHQVQGGTFTLTNVGAVGQCLFGTPIINAPEVGILAMNTLRKAPIVVQDPMTGQDTVTVGHEMYFTLSADHRVLDGADAVRFLSILKGLLEAPERLLWLNG